MSFTSDVAEELLSLPTGKTCCKKALLCGLFYGGKSQAEGNSVTAVFKYEDAARLACELLSKQFSAKAETEDAVIAGRKCYIVKVTSKAIAAFLAESKSSSAKTLRELVGFRCDGCAHEFLRGTFLSSGTVNDPRKGYHLEFSFGDENQAQRLFDFLCEEIPTPKKVCRNGKIGVYYKSNSAIGDLIYYLGATKSSFEFANVFIERDIRNIENRATNCVARNISVSVEASQKHISAIEYIEECHKFESLSEELQYTAKLRLEYDSASLSELAMHHNPPITKSGLNRRLNKILEIAEELKEKR